MKKLIAAVIAASAIQASYSQKSVYTELPERLFTEGKEMFNNHNYVGCINTLGEYKKQSKDAQLWQEADYMIISSLFFQGKSEAADLLKDYLDKYPETYHRNQICFLIGTSHFDKKDWAKAQYWFSQVDMDYLTLSEQEDYSYRMAYSSLQKGNTREAARLFGLLTQHSLTYQEPASYYLAYINFQNGEYAQALPVFERLRNRAEYRENATFYLLQGKFAQQDLNGAIADGQTYLSNFPNSEHATEVYRILGNSYYRLGDRSKAISYYEKYMSRTTQPFREDAYQLADAYYGNVVYAEAAKTLRSVVSTDDQLGQAGYMLLGESYLKLNETANALLAFDAAARAKFDPTISEDALYNYVMIMNRDGVSAFGQAVTASMRFLDEYPKSRYLDDVNSTLANTLLSTKNYPMALEAISRIKSPGKQILSAKQDILLQIGIQDFIDGKYDDALRDFDATIAMGNYSSNARSEAYLWHGDVAYRKADYKTAVKDYSTYLSQASSSKENYSLALYNLAYANFQLKDYDSALSNFKKYVAAEQNRKSPNYPDALNRIGDTYLYQRNFTESARYYSLAVDANPANADYSEFQKAFVLGLQRDYNGKISALNSMMTKYPTSQYYPQALFEKSRALVMLSKDADAINVLEKLLSDYPKSNATGKAGVQLGQLYFNNNNSTKAIEAYKKVIANNPNTEEARTAMQSLEAVYKDINDINSYVAYANTLGKGAAVSANRQDSLTYLAAESVYMKGRKADAKSSLSKYVQNYPNGAYASDAHFYLGSIDFEAKAYASALDHFRAVIRSNNRKYLDDALIYASGIEYDNKNYTSAYGLYEHLNEVATTDESRYVAQLGMLRSAYMQQKDTEVIAAATRLLSQNRASSDVVNEARFYRGQSLRNVKRNDEAIVDLQAVAKNTRTVFGAEAQYLLAEIYYKSKSYDKAEKQILAFMKEGTPHEYWMARGIILLSDVYVAKGDNFQASQYLQSLKANYKGSESDINTMITERLNKLK